MKHLKKRLSISNVESRPSQKYIGVNGFPYNEVRHALEAGSRVVLIARHGFSEGAKAASPQANFEARLIGRKETNQFNMVLSSFSDVLGYVASSPFPRTLETADAVLPSTFDRANVHIRLDLAEMADSSSQKTQFSTLSSSFISQQLESFVPSGFSKTELESASQALSNQYPEGGEGLWGDEQSAGRQRLGSALRDILTVERAQLSLVITHGVVIYPARLKSYLTGMPVEGDLDNPKPDDGHEKFGPNYSACLIVKIDRDSKSSKATLMGYWTPS